MKRRKKASRGQKTTIALLAVAGILLAGSAVGSTRAALSYSVSYTHLTLPTIA